MLGTKLRTVHLFLKYLTNLTKRIKRRLKTAATALEIICLAVCLTLNLLTTTIVAPPSNASKWQMVFNSAFKGLKMHVKVKVSLSLKACKESFVDPRGEKNLVPLPDFETPDLAIIQTTQLRVP